MKKIAIDSYYYTENSSYTVGVIFDSWTDSKPSTILSTTTENVGPYVPGQFYKRELPGILDILGKVDLNGFDTILVDGFVWLLDQDGTYSEGLGKKLWNALGKPKDLEVIGVAKTLFGRCSEICVPVLRGEAIKPLWVDCVGSTGLTKQEAAELVRGMAGPYRIPSLLKILDTETKKYKA